MLLWMTADVALALVYNISNNTDHPTLTEAITRARAGDRLLVDGVYDESVRIDRDLILDGAQTAEVRWNNAGSQVIEVALGVSLTVRGVDITSTTTRGIKATEGGSTVTLADLTIRTGVVGAGGGVELTNPAGFTAVDVVFDGTTATTTGGAIHVSSGTLFPLSLTNTTFRGTSAGTNGGAVYSQLADLSCEGCSFEGTTADNGGAIYDIGGSMLDVRDSTFTGTSVSGSGGALFLTATTAGLTVERSTFCGSTATAGGAISGAPVSATVRASTFVEGSAGGVGAAIYATGGAWIVSNNHFIGHSGGPAVKAQNASTSMDLVNDLFLDSATFGVDGSGASVNVAYSNFFGNTNDSVGATFGNGNLFVDPELRQWSSDGDCTNDDLRPDWTSPLLDVGDPALRDPDGSRSDIGAYGGPAADPANHVDADNDGVSVLHDCDDEERLAYPGARERCDGVDNDCDGDVDLDAIDETSWYQDCDGDNQGDLATRIDQCDDPGVGACPWLSIRDVGPDAWSDCDDDDDTVYFGADEYCEAGDQNCDGDDDLGSVDGQAYFLDADDDTYGDAVVYSCRVGEPGHVSLGGDCNDLNPFIHPNAPDPCDDQFDSDSDCNGLDGTDAEIRDWYPDGDGDGFGDPYVNPEPDCTDRAPGGGFTTLDSATDCDDTSDAVHPGAEELCNLVDDDCDDTIDDVIGDPKEWFEDRDQDTFGNRQFPYLGICPPEEGWILVGEDCDDTVAEIHPGVPEVCNEVDDDCDDLVDADDPGAEGTVGRWPDADLDGYGACDDGEADCPPEQLCPDEVDENWSENNEDCLDGLAEIHPGAVDIPGDDLDQDCSGSAEPAKPSPDPDPGGCGCDATPGLPALASLVPVLALVRRRRRSAAA